MEKTDKTGQKPSGPMLHIQEYFNYFHQKCANL